jgi:hypothetical protein
VIIKSSNPGRRGGPSVNTVLRGVLCGALLLALHQIEAFAGLSAQAARQFASYSDAQAIFDALRSDLLPAELRDASNRESRWTEWVRQHDKAIRARVAAGDEDSLIHLLLFGTSFTKTPRASDRDLATLVTTPDTALAALRARIDDFAAAVISPGTNERLRFARSVIEGRGIALTEAGRAELRRYLDQRTQAVGASVESSRLLDPKTELSDKLTLFRDRGLSTDTSVFIDFGIEQALDAMKAAGALRAGSVRRVALIGPGLDFTDKLDGYDFYPEQTIQPFALVETLLRLELADNANLSVTALDISPRILQHLNDARARATAASSYTVVLPRNTERPWNPDLVDYWQRFGNWIGVSVAKPPAAPPNAGRLEVRGVSIRPEIVLSVTPVDLNIVTERPAESAGGPFDLIVATNILLYYDVFDQSLAAANIARMLRPGGFLLTNNRIFELPESPISGVGFTDVVYMSLPGIGETGDRIIWYQKQ